MLDGVKERQSRACPALPWLPPIFKIPQLNHGMLHPAVHLPHNRGPVSLLLGDSKTLTSLPKNDILVEMLLEIVFKVILCSSVNIKNGFTD